METSLSGWLQLSQTGNLYSQKQVVRFTFSQSAVKIFSVPASGSRAWEPIVPMALSDQSRPCPLRVSATLWASGLAWSWGYYISGRELQRPVLLGKAGQKELLGSGLLEGPSGSLGCSPPSPLPVLLRSPVSLCSSAGTLLC